MVSRTMSGSTHPSGRRAELYVRSLLPEGSRDQWYAVYDRVDALADGGRIRDCSVQVWGKQAPATRADARTDAGVYALDRVSAFREWARKNGRSVDVAFEKRTVDSELTGDHYRSVVFPTLLLAEYRDGKLACVTPHADDGSVTTVQERLAAIENGTATEFEPVDRTPGSRGAPTRLDRTDPERRPRDETGTRLNEPPMPR